MRDIVGKLDVGYNRVTFKVAGWSHFFATKQQNEQTLVQHANHLRDRTITSNFPMEVMDDLLSAVFVNAVQRDITRRYLLQKDLSFEQTLDAARKFETGRQEAKRNHNNSEVKFEKRKRRRKGKGKARKRKKSRTKAAVTKRKRAKRRRNLHEPHPARGVARGGTEVQIAGIKIPNATTVPNEAIVSAYVRRKKRNLRR